MEDKKDTNPKGIVVENVGRGHVLRLRLKQYAKPVGIVLLVLMVAGGAGVGLRLLQGKKASPEIVYPRNPLPQKVEDAQNLRASGDFAGAAKAIDEGLANSNTSNDEKYQLYIQQGSIASDKKDYVAASASYEKAAALKQTFEIYTLLGDNWRLAKDNVKAVMYYKKALPLIDMSKPLADDDKASLEKLIASLENGTPLERTGE